jgi:DNA-binding Lrp family transcriptional regulator
LPRPIDVIAGEIMAEMEKLLLERVFCAFLKAGTVLYASTALDNHLELMKLFSITEFNQMRDLDHAFPLPGTNLALFKAKDILIGLYTKKGYQGQLLAFKTKMIKYIDDLNAASEASLMKPIEIESKGQILPKLVETISLTVGLSEDESSVLKLCDGSHTLGEIQIKTRLPRKNVVDIIRHFEAKGWLRLDHKGEIGVLPISIKKFPETAVRLGMISKKTYDINELCDGNNSVQDICEKLRMTDKEIQKILEKMEENKIIKMTVKIPEEERPTERVEVAELKVLENPELDIKPALSANISFSMGFDDNEKRVLQLLDGAHTISDIHTVTQIPFVEIFRIVIKYEEKGWVRVPIETFKYIVGIKVKLKSELLTSELEAKYAKVMGEQVPVPENLVETSVRILDESAGLAKPQILAPSLDQEKDYLLKRIQAELPLMPASIQAQVINKLLKVPKAAREDMLIKLMNSESSLKFKKKVHEEIRFPPPIPEPPPVVIKPAKLVEQPAVTIEEPELIKPSELFKESLSPEVKPSVPPESAPIPEIPPAATSSEIMEPKPPSQVALRKEIPLDEEQVSEVLNFIDSLLGIPEILYLALIDSGGNIFYQTTKESELWDISKDTNKLIQNWNSQAPSIFIGKDIKYATIKASPEILIATNIKGSGHIVAIPINETLFILTKLNKDGDAPLIADDIAIVAKQINQMLKKK